MSRRTIATVVILGSILTGSCQATLVGSLLFSIDHDVEDVSEIRGVATRTSSGDVNTRGLVAGSMSFLGDNADESKADFLSWSDSCAYLNVTRYANSVDGGGVVAWDYDLSRVKTEGIWSLNVNFRKNAMGNMGGLGTSPTDCDVTFWISYNGDGLTLDATDLSAAKRGANGLVISNSHEYIQIATIEAGKASGSFSVDLTSQIDKAKLNGGRIRLVMTSENFAGDIVLNGATGIVTGPATFGSLLSRRYEGALCLR